jgi:multidrug efflux system membrane fusion protein
MAGILIAKVDRTAQCARMEKVYKVKDSNMKRRTISALVLLSCGLLGMAGCKKEQTKADLPVPTVTVAQPVTREVQDFDEYTGKIQAIESVEVRAKVKGYLVSVGFKDGDEVKKDQPLFQIDPQPFEAALKEAQGHVEIIKAR